MYSAAAVGKQERPRVPAERLQAARLLKTDATGISLAADVHMNKGRQKRA